MVTSQQGVTFIELMAVVAIIALLAIVATPYTARWAHEAQVSKAHSLLQLAHSQAKALALRNPDQVTGNQVAGCAMLQNGFLMVGESCSEAGVVGDIWQQQWPEGVEEVDGNEIVLRYNNRGQSVDEHEEPKQITFRLGQGDVTDDIQFR